VDNLWSKKKCIITNPNKSVEKLGTKSRFLWIIRGLLLVTLAPLFPGKRCPRYPALNAPITDAKPLALRVRGFALTMPQRKPNHKPSAAPLTTNTVARHGKQYGPRN
jgi:hypothetical protein